MPEIIFVDAGHQEKRNYMRKCRADKGAVYESLNYYKRKTKTKAKDLKHLATDSEKLSFLKTKAFILDNQNKLDSIKSWVHPSLLP